MLCFSKLPLAKKRMDKRWRKVSKIFPRKFVTSKCRNFSLWNPLMFLQFRGLCHDLLSNTFCLAVPEDFVREPFCAAFQKISDSEKLMDKSGWGSIKISPSQIFVS